MVLSVTIGWGIAIILAIVLLWAGLILWPYKRDPLDLFGLGALFDAYVRIAGALAGTVVLMAIYIALKLAGVC